MIKRVKVYEGQQPTAEQLAELEKMDKRAINLDDIPDITEKEINYVKELKNRRVIDNAVA